MELFDPRTLLLTITLLLAARAAVLAFVWRMVRDYTPAAYWTAGSILIAVGALLAGLREIAPVGISIVLAQSCIVPGGMLVDAGTMIAAGRRLPWRPALALLLALLPPLLWYTYGNPDYIARTVLTTLPAVLFDSFALVACWRATRGRSVITLRILAVVLAVMVASNLFKLFGAAGLQTTSLLQPGPPLIQFLLISMVSFTISTGLYVLLAAQWLQEQLDQELAVRKQTEAELKRHRDGLEVLVRERTRALEESGARLAQNEFAMERVGLGISWADAETGRFIHVNDDACRQLGYTRDELLTMGISDINPSVPPGAPDAMTRTLASEGRFRIETSHRRKDGTHYLVEVTAYLNRVDDREWFIAFFKDITQRKAAEADLITAKEAAETANRAKTAFLGNMSHELRTPMNAIMGMSFLIRHHTDDHQLHHYLDEVDSASNGLLRIINNVLDIAQIESDRLEVVPVEFCLPEVLEKVERLVAAEIAKKGLAFSVEISQELAMMTLRGDAMRLGQILNSLVGNAVKFTAQGKVMLKTAFHDSDDGGLLLHVDVIDTGIGIDASDQARLFTAFEQADMTRTRKYGGAGLGLAISQRLVRMMGGEMGVSSEPDAGSHFWFTLRLERA